LVVDVVLRGHKPVGPLEEFEQDRSRPPQLRRNAEIPVSAPAEDSQQIPQATATEVPGESPESAGEPLAPEPQNLSTDAEDSSDALSSEAVEVMGAAVGGLLARRMRRTDKGRKKLLRAAFSKGARLQRRVQR
jgi:hypothetical protein